jgi:hypothetical protein
LWWRIRKVTFDVKSNLGNSTAPPLGCLLEKAHPWQGQNLFGHSQNTK